MTTLPTSDERILKANGLSNALSGLSEGFNKHTTKGGSEFADALHGFAKGFAPEQYEAGRQNAYTSKIGNALKSGDMNAASDLMFDAGRLQDGLNMRSQVQSEQQAEQSKGMQQALALGQHLLQMPDEQSRAAFVSQNWQTFAPMLGANSLEEYLANDPTAFSDADLQNDLRQLQVQMGQGPAPAPENEVINNQLVDPQTGRLIGDYRDNVTMAEGTTMYDQQGNLITKNQKTFTPTDPNSLAIDQQKADASTMQAQAAMKRAEQTRNGITIGPDGTVQIGGTAQQTLTGPSEAQDDYIKAASGFNSANETFMTMMDSIDTALEQSGKWTAGMGSVLAEVPGSPARDLRATLETVRANLGFEKLQEMRDNSPTGGALGQVTERELAFLQAVRGNLDQGQSVEQLKETLGEIKGSLERLQEARKAAFLQRYQMLEEGQSRQVLDPNAVTQGSFSSAVDPADLEYMTPEERALFE